MSEASHTPSPWSVEHGITVGLKKRTVAIYSRDLSRRKGEAVCIVAPEDNYSDEDKANARLIAAAPTLLEALQDVVRNAQPSGPLWFNSEPMVKARAAISAATTP